jgi:hypothetical protein
MKPNEYEKRYWFLVVRSRFLFLTGQLINWTTIEMDMLFLFSGRLKRFFVAKTKW